VLQKLSDPVLSTCPTCGAATFAKQLTAAGFQLKGSGWYATDFKGGSSPAPAAAPAAGDSKPATGGDTGGSAATPAAPAAAASAGSTACGGSCACH
jgi:predicted nucleic acid-binding Zn ribbon protein